MFLKYVMYLFKKVKVLTRNVKVAVQKYLALLLKQPQL